MNKFTVTIGIPAYNEANNIASLLADLVKQKTSLVDIKKINVISDGSNDATVEEAGKIKSSTIEIYEYDNKLGPAARQNQLISLADSEILVLLNADIVIQDPYFIEKLVSPIIKNNASLTSACILELPFRTYFESILSLSMQLKRILFSSFKQGNNLYNCHGPARAFHKNLYKKLHFRRSEGEDMYSYLMCLKNKLKFEFTPSACVYYQLPATFSDHLKQSIRYLNAQSLMNSVDPELAKKELSIPAYAYLNVIRKAFPLILIHPLHILVYLFVLLTVKVKSSQGGSLISSWDVRSSKPMRT